MEYICQNYGRALFGVAIGIVGEREKAMDVLQEALISIWQNALKYDSQKGRLYTWMLNVVRNKAIDEHRKINRQLKIHTQVEDVTAHERGYETNIDLIGFGKQLDKLHPDKKKLIELSYIQGYSHSEISEKLSLPLGTVKMRIRAAMKDLKDIFG